MLRTSQLLLALCISLSAWAQDKADYIWIETKPPEATVYINGETAGSSPVFKGPLKPGSYRVRVTHSGYDDDTSVITLPGDAGKREVKLDQRSGSLRITSKPSGVAVLAGSQLLGNTPAVVEGLAIGEHTLRLQEVGYEHQEKVIQVAANAPPTFLHVDMPLATGSIVVSGMPAGAVVMMDDLPRGALQSVDAAANSATASPLRISGIKTGKHSVYLAIDNAKSEVKEVVLKSGDELKVFLTVWRADVNVKLRNGATVVGMLLEKRDNGDLIVAKTPDNHVRLPAAEVVTVDRVAEKK
ncbi:MAG: hypothetical protein ACI8W8_000563 [Rhodothermales bacterium]|jgi:hypothetical protein